MAWTSPNYTFTTGEIVTAAILNQYLRDQLNETAPAKAAAAGDTFYATGANAIQRVAIGAASTVRRVNSGGTAWEYSTALTEVVSSNADEVVHRIMNY